MSENQAVLSVPGEEVTLPANKSVSVRIEVKPTFWQGAVLFIAGAVCAPLFLTGVWFVCWLVVRAPL